MITLIIALVLLGAYLSYKLYEDYKEKRLFESVRWCVYFDSLRKERPEVRMRTRIFQLQRELSLDARYLITKDELNAITEILLCYRQDVIQEYFNGSYQKAGFAFETSLSYYLEKHQYEYEYRDNITYHKMYYILQQYDLKLNNIVDEDKLGVIMAKATKETIDNLLDK